MEYSNLLAFSNNIRNLILNNEFEIYIEKDPDYLEEYPDADPVKRIEIAICDEAEDHIYIEALESEALFPNSDQWHMLIMDESNNDSYTVDASDNQDQYGIIEMTDDLVILNIAGVHMKFLYNVDTETIEFIEFIN